jgi:zinc transport system substrate-binding protein
MLARLVLITFLLLITGLGHSTPTVVASIAPYADLIGQVAGDRAKVLVMLPAGASPHTYEPTPRAAAALAGADLVVMNGSVDEWLHDLVGATNSNVTVVEAMEVLEPLLAARSGGRGTAGEGEHHETGEEHGAQQREQEAGGHGHEGDNPHVWLDPTLVLELIEPLAEALATMDPDNAEHYRRNARELRSDLLQLDRELAETLAPVAGAPFIPFHDAWPYFADRYGLDLVLEIEPFPGREPSPRYLAEAVSTIRASGAPAIFSEVGLGDRPGRVLAAEAGVELYLLDPLGGGDESYQDLLRRNAATILEALSPWRTR